MSVNLRKLDLAVILSVMVFASASGQDAPTTNKDLSKLPGGTSLTIGHVETKAYELNDGPECEKGRIIVPENRAADDSRPIELHFFLLKARQPSGRSPVFMLPGGPGGFYNDNWVNGLKTKPAGGSNVEAWMFTQDRDVVLVNQRGARLPDRRFQLFRFFAGGTSLRKPFSVVDVSASMKKGATASIEHWTKKGVDLAGYDIMNMVEDINDIRKALGYDEITLRGTSFGSQWSFAYMKKYPEHVDRAVLSGVEPIDYGYDSPQGIWNAFERLETRMKKATGEDNSLNLPEISFTDAIKAVVERLEDEPVTVEGQHSKRDFKRDVPLGVEDFRRYLRTGINAGRESRPSLENLPRFVFEIYGEDYRYLASRTVEQRNGFGGGHLQFLLVDNSLGISTARDAKLDAEPARDWLGELNLIYKATRDVTPSPVVPDSFRTLESEIPMLFVHGDLDLSTPIENALEALETLSNAHLITVVGGTHGAFGQIAMHDREFIDLVMQFMNADFESATVKSLGLPDELKLPALQFKPIGSPSLFEERMADRGR